VAARRIIWSKRAKNDLLTILDFYFQRNGTKTYSSKINSVLNESVKVLTRHPYIGKVTDLQDIRCLIKGDYNIFYEIKAGTIEILTIWNSRQNPEELRIK